MACFEIKSVPSKGLGAFATRDICPGELILEEKPLLRINMSHYLARDVEAAFEKLNDVEKAKYMSLASAHGQNPALYPSAISPSVEDKRERSRIREQHGARIGEEKTVLSVCITNAMQVEKGAGIFEVASRFNHDCVPNACFTWDENKQMEVIYAVQDIPKGSEITLCYCDPFYDISMREWELKHYGFKCICRACIDPDDPKSFAYASRERRWKLRELEVSLGMATNDDERLRCRLEMVATMRAEGLCCPMLANMYLEIARIAERKNDLNMAVKASRKSLEISIICMGPDSQRSLDAAKSVRAFERQLPKGVLKD